VKLTKKTVFSGLITLIILVGIGIFLYWFFHGRFFQSTDDAYVTGNQVVINPQIQGSVTMIDAENTCYVEKGHQLIAIDPTDYIISLNTAKEKLGNACRKVVDLFEQVEEKKADVLAKKARMNVSEQEFQRRQLLLTSGAVSLEDFEQSEAQYLADQAMLLLAETELEAAEMQVFQTTVTTHPQVLEAVELVKDAYVKLKRCKIFSPVSGLVAQRNVQVGQWVTPSDSLMAIIPLSEMWVDANFREVQLKKMRIGQKVRLVSDMYGSDLKYTGTIVGFAGGTGSVFSVLPPQNATGNWVKIIQRLPVRIALKPEELKKHPLRLGLSMTATVDLRDEKGKVIPEPLPPGMIYQTDIFEDQAEGVDLLIKEILIQNIPQRYLEP